ncbi:class I SAM-dependent methyltransferase [Egbenema bharatensis]|uniref:class I SAM-dependent methyltransferase n=1 Tax=Egbenema bharatensis TaxID=3463334 RepID=UPI003A84DEA0
MTHATPSTFNSTLFDGAQQYYVHYRPKYPPELYDRIAQGFNLNGKGKLLDLGCGTGLIALALRDRFEQVIGLDPDPEMLKQAQQQADELGAKNIIWLERSAEQVNAPPNSFKLITIGRAFHWMDRSLIIDRSYDLLETGGGLVLLATHGEDPWTSQIPWKQDILAVVKQWLGDRRRAGQGWWVDPDPPHEELLRRSAFSLQVLYEAEFEQIWTIDSLIGYLYSTAFCLPSFFGDHRQSFEAEIQKVFLSHYPSGNHVEILKASALAGMK